MFNLFTAAYFTVGGASVLSARLVAVTFSVLSLFVLFKLASRMYDSRIALLSIVFFGVMPGVIWVSRLGYIETMLEFFFLLSLFFFLDWLRTDNKKSLIFCGVALGLGFLVKYQLLVAGLVMVATLFVSGRGYLKSRLKSFSILVLMVTAVVLSWFAVTYAFAPGTLSQWIYAISAGDPLRSLYSVRFPIPVFYLVEMTWPYSDFHPISLFLYLLGLVGLGFLAWRRKPGDKFLIVWFAVVYVVFSLVGNRQWRYVMPLFPVLAVSASSVVCFAYDKTGQSWQKARTLGKSEKLAKVAAGFLVVFTATAVFISCIDAYHWVSMDQVNVPIQEATVYVAGRIQANESVMIVCPFEFFSGGIASFYLQTNNKQNSVEHYPELPVDTFTPTFNVDNLILQCQEHNAKYVLISEYQWAPTYFNSTLTPREVAAIIYSSGKFVNETSVGVEPNRVFVLSFG